jgi:hypothetical protein
MKKNHHKTECVRPQTTKYHPPTATYQKRAAKIEKDSHNTNIFNGKNLSDNTPASHFYQVKARPALGDAEVRVAAQPKRQ